MMLRERMHGLFMRWSLPLVVLGATCAQAFASGGAACESEGGPAKVALEAGITRGMGSPVFQLSSTIEIADQKVAKDLRISAFTRENMAQYWLDGEDLRFVLYRERDAGDFASVEARIEAKAVGDDATYAGTYIVTIFQPGSGDPLKFEGQINCSVE